MRTVAYLAVCAVLGAAFVYVGVRVSMWLDRHWHDSLFCCLGQHRQCEALMGCGCECHEVDGSAYSHDDEQARYDRRFAEIVEKEWSR